MKKMVVILMAIVLAVQSSILLTFAGVDDELALLRDSIKSIKDIDEDMYSKLEDVIVRKFSDAKKGDWYMRVMTKLVGLGAIDGTDKGTLNPLGTVTRAMFIKMFIRAMYGAEDIEGIVPDFVHWAARDIKKAEEIGLIKPGEFTLKNIGENITRGEMAKIIVRAYSQFEEHPLTFEDCKELADKIKSKELISDDMLHYAAIAYGAGIIAGYEDGRFGAMNAATRAQAAAFIIRYLDPSERVKVEDEEKPREPTILRWDDPYRPLPKEGDTFIKLDGTAVVLKIGPAGVLGENQNCDLYGGMAYPSGNLVEHGRLGTASLGHLGETYLVDEYGEGHWWPEWKKIRQYYSDKAYEEIKNPKEGQTYGKWFIFKYGKWCWIGPTNQ